MAVDEFLTGTSVTIWVTFRTRNDPFAAAPTYTYYDPAAPTVIVKRKDGSTFSPTPTLNKWNAAVGHYTAVLTVDATGLWSYEGVDPTTTQPGGTIGHFYVYANPLA